MAALYRGTEGSPLGRAMGESFRATLEYLLECIPQLLICALPERVQILPYGVREEDRFLWIDGYRRRRPWPVKIMTRGKTSERVKTTFFSPLCFLAEGAARQRLTGQDAHKRGSLHSAALFSGSGQRPFHKLIVASFFFPSCLRNPEKGAFFLRVKRSAVEMIIWKLVRWRPPA